MQQTPQRKRGGVLILSFLATLGLACGDDVTVTPPDDTGSSGGTTTSAVTLTTMTTTTGEDTTAGTGTATTGEDTTAGEDTTTGGEMMLPGQTQSQLVSAGTRAASRNYSLVYTVGQPSQLQSTHTSANYRIQGGLIGANGSPP